MHWLHMKEVKSQGRTKQDYRNSWRKNRCRCRKILIRIFRSISRYHEISKILKNQWTTIKGIFCSSFHFTKKPILMTFWNLMKEHLIYSKKNVNKMFKKLLMKWTLNISNSLVIWQKDWRKEKEVSSTNFQTISTTVAGKQIKRTAMESNSLDQRVT